MISKIRSKEEEAKRRRRNQILLGGGLVFLLLASTAGFSLMSSNHGGQGTGDSNSGALLGASLEEYGVTFTRQHSFWVADIQGQPFYFQYLPSEVEHVVIEGAHSITYYQGQVLYFVNSKGDATGEILNNLQPYVLRYQDACLEGISCTNEELPIKTCADNVIIAQEDSDETRVYKEENCVYISGDQIKGADAFLYRSLGIL